MISSHVYGAYLIGSPDVELSLIGGSITMDDTAAPHVQADIEIGWPGHWEVVPDDLPTAYGGLVWITDHDLLAALDPKNGARVRVEVEGTYPSFSATREFDLGVRSRVPDQVSRVVRLGLGSDEKLLDDYRALADVDLIDLAGDLATLCETVVGVALDAPVTVSGETASLTPYWAVTNQHPNPVPASAAGYGAGGGSASVTYVTTPSPAVRWTSSLNASNLICAGSLTAFRVTPGKTYVFAVEHASEYAGRGVQVAIQWRNNGSSSALSTIYGSSGTSAAGTAFTRRHIIATAPAGAEYAYPLILTTGNTVASFHFARQAMFYEGRWLVPFFSGATADDAHYTYDWADPAAPNATSSTRTPINDSPSPEAFTWKAGVSALEFLRPLVQAAGLRLVCDETRAWTLRDEHYLAEGSLNLRYGVNLIDGSDTIDRDSGLWFDAQVTRYRWTDPDGLQREAVDAYALNDPPTRVNRVEINAPYPGPGRSEYAVRRAQGRGREVTASAVARWNEHAEQSITVTLDGAPLQTGKTSRVTFDLGPGESRDRVTVTTRTTDTAPDAVDLLEGTVNALAGIINDLP